ncbi:hypothetical protein HJC23_002018 [Cyclotella cryptica]|uniref:N-acetyltransferase domain-containing protein n=1 Tax=Cyclotella cryptica TaxID=29204 RepID=A0ABD3NRI1_9STRA
MNRGQQLRFLPLLHYTLLVLLSSSTTIVSSLHTPPSEIIIAAPSSISDYRRLASLIVSTFDDSAPESSERDPSIFNYKWDALKWNLYEKSLTEEFTYRQYASTARRMRGKKYCLLVAKEEGLDSGQPLSGGDCNVVGMVEMGLSICPSYSVIDVFDSQEDEHKDESLLHTSDGRCNRVCIPQPTIGVLCIKSTHQNRGIGRKLIQKCEKVARELWEEPQIFVDVEPDNVDALAFFEKCGYHYCMDRGGTAQILRNTTVFRRRMEEVKPHWLLRKKLGGSDLEEC